MERSSGVDRRKDILKVKLVEFKDEFEYLSVIILSN